MKSKQKTLIGVALLGLITLGCQSKPKEKSNTMDETSSESAAVYALPDPQKFNTTHEGKAIKLFILKNGPIQAAITNYGARMVGMLVPDKDGNPVDVLTGYNSIDEYLKQESYFGCVVGRYGNRIAKGKFTLNGKTYTLATNNGVNHLHGGPKGFCSKVWDAKQIDSSTVEFNYLSKDMEEGYPGNLQVKVTYSLTADRGVKIQYSATTDKPTVLNLTNHNYWNLDGERDTSINDHLLQIYASKYTPVDSTLIPTGELASVEGTPFDFRKPTAIGDRVNADHPQIKYGKGYDHNFVLIPQKVAAGELPLIATVQSAQTGIKMEVLTSEPGIQFYSGNFLTGSQVGKGGQAYVFRSSLCLETQHFPDSPNQPKFPTTTLNPGQTYATSTVYRFPAQ
ncbi:aldose epimerase family protein [Haliscomenobacter hydrossis]|uniref:Aldose 1-epimerase n=1 Tax=Haliscomenobacter hydrossis (strain ATCC 27775 / DSM 1100 / LMG 10767 / O) TaxID=760192 RepID=F4KUV3_HALH1|nr:aldose epimerase family protein [Haliscomenobacter hydrossis]AEE48129.1 Aldose 1-epimerase [Haliscomenobacter hydrossis DSM 1100]